VSEDANFDSEEQGLSLAKKEGEVRILIT